MSASNLSLRALGNILASLLFCFVGHVVFVLMLVFVILCEAEDEVWCRMLRVFLHRPPVRGAQRCCDLSVMVGCSFAQKRTDISAETLGPDSRGH